nr:solute carrier family 2, facilitated glucose transporter member 8-like [Procambarus clarkii]
MAEPSHSALHLLGDSTPSHTTQYLATLAACLGGLVMGTGLGYSSPAGPLLMTNTTGETLHLTQQQYDWFISSLNLGGVAGSLGGGLCTNQLGRRPTMLLTGPLSLAGWALIAFGQNFAMLAAGRVLIGASMGATCTAAPTYVGEVASPDIRGALASGHQLMITLGMLLAYFGGIYVSSWRWLAVICGAPNLLYIATVYFTRESPTFLLAKGKMREAAASLQHFRGARYDIEEELQMTKQSLEEGMHTRVTFKEVLKPYILRPFLLCLTVFATVQLSGAGAILLNMAIIFQASGVRLDDNINVVIVGVMQVVATGLSAVLMDRAGRRLLLVLSLSFMSLSLAPNFMSVHCVFPTTGERLGWLPLVSMCVFISSFALGPGPIAWVLLGELLHPRVKEATTGIVTLFSWGLGFVVNLTFLPLEDALGSDGIYLLFAAMALCGLLVIVAGLPETKGKSLQEIAEHFGRPKYDPNKNAVEDDPEVYQGVNPRENHFLK